MQYRLSDTVNVSENVYDYSRFQDGITYLVGAGGNRLFCKKLSYREEPFYEVEDINVESQCGTMVCLTAIDHTVYSCRYDIPVKSWVLTNTGLVHDRTYEMYVITKLFLSDKPLRHKKTERGR